MFFVLFFSQSLYLSLQWNPTGDEQTSWQMSFRAMNLTPLGVVGGPDTTNEMAQLPCFHSGQCCCGCQSVRCRTGVFPLCSLEERPWQRIPGNPPFRLTSGIQLCNVITHGSLINSCHGQVAPSSCHHHLQTLLAKPRPPNKAREWGGKAVVLAAATYHWLGPALL